MAKKSIDFSYHRPDEKQGEREIIAEGVDIYKEGMAKREDIKEKERQEQEEREVREAIEKKLVPCDLFIEANGREIADEIYDWYIAAMSKRNRQGLERSGFIGHFFGRSRAEGEEEYYDDNGYEDRDRNYMFGDNKRGYLMGVINDDVFIPTHFAPNPKTTFNGISLFKEIVKGKIPVLLAITEDLADTLKMMPGWKVEDFSFTSHFRGAEVKKVIVHNNKPQIEKLKMKLMGEYLGHVQEQEDNDAPQEDGN